MRIPVGSGDFMIGGTLWPGLSKLIEEMGEVQQIAGKLIGSAGNRNHWSGDLAPKFEEELGDMIAAVEFFLMNNTEVARAKVLARAKEKLILFMNWHLDAQEKSDA